MDYNKEQLEQNILLADQYIKDNEIAAAKELLFQTIAEDPLFAKAYNYLGWIFETKEKRYKDAEENYKRSIDLDPTYHAPYINYLYLLNNQQRSTEAFDLINIAKDIKGINRVTLNTEWAYALEYSGRLEEAIEKYKEIIPLQNDLTKLEGIKKDIDRCRQKLELLKY